MYKRLLATGFPNTDSVGKNNLRFFKTKKIWTRYVPEHNFYYTQVYIWLYIDEAGIYISFSKLK